MQALYASKICSYAQGMNVIRAKSMEQNWNLNLGELARIWKGGCIIRAKFLDRIKKVRNLQLPASGSSAFWKWRFEGLVDLELAPWLLLRCLKSVFNEEVKVPFL